MTQQETKAVEDAANEQVPTDGCAFFHYSDADIWKEGFIQGAQFLATLRKPIEPDKELLEALKHAKSLITLSSILDDAIINRAIFNYEKQR